MAMHDWLTPGAVLAILGLLLSAMTLRMTMRVDRRQRSNDYPTVNVDLVASREATGWLEAMITLRNATESGWTLEKVVFPWPQRVKTIERWDALVDNGYGSRVLSLEKLARASRNAAPMRTKVAAAGTPRSTISSGDVAHTRLFLSLERPRRSISMRLILRSKDAKQRIITIAVKREVPADTAIAND